MTLGKKERMIAVIVVIAGLAAAIHFLVFQQKAKTYDQTSQEYTAAKEKLTNAEFILDPQAFEQYKAKTTQYEALETSVAAELNLQKADYQSSPPLGRIDMWASPTIAMLNELNAKRSGTPALTFLDQTGWDLTSTLPSVGAVGALADRMSNLINIYGQLAFVTEPMQQAQARNSYNAALQAIGIPPAETSYFYYPQFQLFFNNENWLTSVLRMGNQSMSGDLTPYYNPYGLQRFGQSIPILKKIWVFNLVMQELQRQNSQIDPQLLARFGEALELGIPLGENEPRNSINKQLRALLDIIDIAGRSGIRQITSVKFLRPINVAKATLFVPGATPAPTATPAATPNTMGGGMMMDPLMADMMIGGGPMQAQSTVTPVPDAEKVGTGAGIELDLTGDNASITRFYYEVSHITRTYGLDDVYFFQDQNGALRTTSTIEVITDVKMEGGATAEAAPVQ